MLMYNLKKYFYTSKTVFRNSFLKKTKSIIAWNHNFDVLPWLDVCCSVWRVQIYNGNPCGIHIQTRDIPFYNLYGIFLCMLSRTLSCMLCSTKRNNDEMILNFQCSPAYMIEIVLKIDVINENNLWWSKSDFQFRFMNSSIKINASDSWYSTAVI